MSKEPEPRARRRVTRRVIDWHRAAELLACGLRITAVARRVGCSRAALSRKRRHDPHFQGWLARCREAQPEPEGPLPAELRRALQAAIEKEVGKSNVRVLLWLADRLKLVTPPSERTPQQELRELLDGLTTEELREFESLRDES